MNCPTFLDRLNFLREVPTLSIEAHDTDIVLSNEILALSQAAEDAIWPLLHTSPDGLEPAEVQARLALVGPNLHPRRAPEHRAGIVGARKEPLERTAAQSRRHLLFPWRCSRRGGHFGHRLIGLLRTETTAAE